MTAAGTAIAGILHKKTHTLVVAISVLADTLAWRAAVTPAALLVSYPESVDADDTGNSVVVELGDIQACEIYLYSISYKRNPNNQMQ